jgi:hypothetical protein
MDRSALLGMTTGAVFMFAFGAVWLCFGLFRGRPLPPWLRLSLVIAAIVVVASITTLAIRALHMPPNLSLPTPDQIAASHRIALHFYVIAGIELVAIFMAVAALNVFHYPDYILCGIALIVGVHFFPLAALFRAPVFYGTALIGCSIGLAGFLVANAELRQKVVGLSFGLLLWATASWISWVGIAGVPRIVSHLPH